DTDAEAHERRCKRDGERDAKAMQRPHQQVATEPVRAKPVAGRFEGRRRHVRPVDLVFAIIEECRTGEGREHQQSQDHETYNRSPVAAQRIERLAAESQRHWARSRRIRGSSAAYARSASKLNAIISAA